VEVTDITCETESRDDATITIDYTITLTEEELADTDFEGEDDINEALDETEEQLEEEGLPEFIYGCTDSLACLFYDEDANIDDGSCLYDDCAGECGGVAEFDDCGECGGDNSSCTGCMDEAACNYDEYATIEGECEYQEEGFDCDGNELSNVFDDLTFSLAQNYPNPFNPETMISFSVTQISDISLGVYDINGRLIDLIVDGVYAPGNYLVRWDGMTLNGEPVSSGMYIYKLISAEGIISKRLTVVR